MGITLRSSGVSSCLSTSTDKNTRSARRGYGRVDEQDVTEVEDEDGQDEARQRARPKSRAWTLTQLGNQLYSGDEGVYRL